MILWHVLKPFSTSVFRLCRRLASSNLAIEIPVAWINLIVSKLKYVYLYKTLYFNYLNTVCISYN